MRIEYKHNTAGIRFLRFLQKNAHDEKTNTDLLDYWRCTVELPPMSWRGREPCFGDRSDSISTNCSS